MSTIARPDDDHGRPPVRQAAEPLTAPEIPDGEVNLTDPDSQLMKAYRHYVQGYNAQAAVNEGQIVLAAEITETRRLLPPRPDGHRHTQRARARRRDRTPRVALADAGFWNEQHMDQVTANKRIQVLIPPDSGKRNGPRPGWTGGRYDWMRAVLATDLGNQLYRKRKQMIEPVFGHTKHNRLRPLPPTRQDRRQDRMATILMTHNLTKLHSHQLAIGN